jgi:peptidoglycan/xylan/chitin deacetylase (PgdA/CDA1 family)
MDLTQSQQRRRAQAERRRRARRRGFGLLAGMVAAVAVIAALLGSSGGTAATGPRASDRLTRVARRDRAGVRRRGVRAGARQRSTVSGQATGKPGRTAVPVLMYHVINPPIAGAPYPGLYVPAAEFAAQMQALKNAGWHAVTLDQLWAYWTRGVPLGPGRPFVLTFDNGYQSQYTNALPVLARLHWVGVENIQLSGLPPSQGGLSPAQVRGLIDAGWELDTQGISHADLPALDAAELRYQVQRARRLLQRRYGVPVNWFCYPSGQYDARVIAAVKAAGFIGSTTVVPGWASPADDPYTLPRVRVSGGTTPADLLAELDAERGAAPPPSSYVTG